VNKMEKISFNEFKRTTHHKKVKYRWITSNGLKDKSFESDKFYCNKCYKSKLFSVPFFGFGIETEFFKLDYKTFLGRSESGETKFEIIGG